MTTKKVSKKPRALHDAVPAWAYQGPAQRGAPFLYSDLAIETALTLRLIYHLLLRQTEGFVESIVQLMGLDLSAPDHSTLCGDSVACRSSCPPDRSRRRFR